MTTATKTKPNLKQESLKLLIYFSSLFALFIVSGLVSAGGGGPTDGSLGDISQTVTDSMTNVAKLITAASYVAGVGFAMMGMLKFKAHKDNPTQVPLSQPIVLLCIAAGLIFLPNLISTSGATIWGDNVERATSTGTLGDSSHDGGGG